MVRWKSSARNKRNIILFFLLAVIVVTVISGTALQSIKSRQITQQAQIDALRQEILLLQTEIERVQSKTSYTAKQIEKVAEKLQSWEIDILEVTAYAPLDSRAIEGMCFSGNPSVTASGEELIPGITVAAGRDVPFGTNVWIYGIGRRIVQDRGGRITNRHLDIAVETKEEALNWGRRDVVVFFEPKKCAGMCGR